jgi:hypothetical protein
MGGGKEEKIYRGHPSVHRDALCIVYSALKEKECADCFHY